MKAKRTGKFVTVARRLLVAGLTIAFLVTIATQSMSYLPFIALALVPAAVAAWFERTGERAASTAIASMTVATLLPQLFGAINAEGRDLLYNPAAWSFICAAVLSGIAVYLLLPAATVWLDDRRADRRLKKLRQMQDDLERDWGPEVRANLDR